MNSLAFSPQNANFDYTAHFGGEALGHQAQEVNRQLLGFVQRTLKDLLALGSQLWNVFERCCLQLGADQGKKAFDSWLASGEFGGSRYMADAAMALSPWYENLPPTLQRLVVTSANTWSVAALRELPKLTYELVEQLVREGKQTAKSLKCAWASVRPKRHLVRGELATEADWQLVSQKYFIIGDSLETLKLEAKQNAKLNPETGNLSVKTDDIVAALEAEGYDPASVLPKAQKPRGAAAHRKPEKPVATITQLASLWQQKQQLQRDFHEAMETDNQQATRHINQDLSALTQEFNRVASCLGLDSAVAVKVVKAIESPSSEEVAAPSVASNQELFTAEQVQQKIREALAAQEASTKEESARLLEKKEQELALYRAQLKEKQRQIQQELATKKTLESENSRKQRENEQLRQRLSLFEKHPEGEKKNPAANSSPQSVREDYQTLLAQKDAQISQLSRQVEGYKSLSLPLTDSQLFVGAGVKVIADPDGWAGETGTVVSRGNNGDWWVQLKRVYEQGNQTLNLFKAGQLAFNVSVNSNRNLDVPFDESKEEAKQKAKPKMRQLEDSIFFKAPEALLALKSHKRKKARGFGTLIRS